MDRGELVGIVVLVGSDDRSRRAHLFAGAIVPAVIGVVVLAEYRGRCVTVDELPEAVVGVVLIAAGDAAGAAACRAADQQFLDQAASGVEAVGGSVAVGGDSWGGVS